MEGSNWRLLLERGEMLTWSCANDNDWTPGEKNTQEDDSENQAQNLKPCQKPTPTTSNHQVHIRKTFSSQYLFFQDRFWLVIWILGRNKNTYFCTLICVYSYFPNANVAIFSFFLFAIARSGPLVVLTLSPQYFSMEFSVVFSSFFVCFPVQYCSCSCHTHILLINVHL